VQQCTQHCTTEPVEPKKPAVRGNVPRPLWCRRAGRGEGCANSHAMQAGQRECILTIAVLMSLCFLLHFAT